MRPIERIARSLQFSVPQKGVSVNCHCPAHEDNRTSLSVKEAGDGTVLLYCHAGCPTALILESKGLSYSDLYPDRKSTSEWLATYDYTDGEGHLAYQVIRKVDKQFRQRRPDANSKDGWAWNMKGQRRLMYRLPKIQQAVESGAPVFIVEGEKDVHTLERLQLTASTNSGGANKFKTHSKDLLPQFDGIQEVFILPDNDKTGIGHAEQIACQLFDVVETVKVINLPRLEEKEDITDWLNKRNGSSQELLELCATAPAWKPSVAATDLADEEDEKQERKSQAQLLLEFAQGLKIFATPKQEGFVWFPVNDHFETRPIRSRAFRNWMAMKYYRQHGKPPGSQAVQDALGVLEARAMFEGDSAEVFLRVCEKDGSVYIDLGDDTWDAVKITAEGWEIVKNPPVYFRRSSCLAPMPRPALEGDLSVLRKHTGFDDANHALLCGYLVQAFNPNGPYPVLNLTGEQGSAKSTRTKQVRAIVDPSEMEVRSQPRGERDLLIAARNNWVLALDNLSSLPHWLSDALCRISTGGGFGARTLYEDKEETVFSATRPVILNGIEDFATRPDLLDRSISLQLPVIPKSERKPEKKVWKTFNEDLPTILAGVLDAVSVALARVDQIELDELPRMADFAIWAVAAEPAFGVPEGTFLQAYNCNRNEAIENAIDADLVAAAIQKLLEETQGHRIEVTAGELIEELKSYLPNPERPPKGYPANPQAMAGRLRRIMPALRAVNIERVDLPRKDNRRAFTLEWQGDKSSGMSEASEAISGTTEEESQPDMFDDDQQGIAVEERHLEKLANAGRRSASDKTDVHDKLLQLYAGPVKAIDGEVI